VGDRIFTQEQRRNEEVVVCYHAQTGRQLWVHADSVKFDEPMGGVGPRATPTLFDSRLYTLGATGILNCLDAITGEPLWPQSVNILEDAGADNLEWAMAGSPLVYDDLVVVNAGGRQGRGVIAYDRFSGTIRWATGNDPASFCAPRLETINGVRQILIFDGFGLKGHDAATGDELWRTREWTNEPKVNAAGPIVRDGHRIFIASGYGVGCGLFKIMFADGSWSVREEYVRPNRFKLKFNDAIYYDNHLYGLDEGILACHNFDTGRRVWKRGRYGYGQLLLVHDVLLIQAESGEVALVEANPNAFREIARFQAIDGKTWNHPVLHRGRLFVRNAQEAACYDLRPNPNGRQR
jgi:outer membrane protein assembly factor BamB